MNFLLRLQSVPNNSCSWGLWVHQRLAWRLRYLIRCDSNTLFPFHLVIEAPGQNFMYSPRSDFHMCIKDFPHILLEVKSEQNQSDRYRMVLQASCICRIGNWLRAPTYGKQIVIMAVYVDEDFNAFQYLLYQPDVVSKKVAFNWLTRSLWLMQSFLGRVRLSEVRFDKTPRRIRIHLPTIQFPLGSKSWQWWLLWTSRTVIRGEGFGSPKRISNRPYIKAKTRREPRWL